MKLCYYSTSEGYRYIYSSAPSDRERAVFEESSGRNLKVLRVEMKTTQLDTGRTAPHALMLGPFNDMGDLPPVERARLEAKLESILGSSIPELWQEMREAASKDDTAIDWDRLESSLSVWLGDLGVSSPANDEPVKPDVPFWRRGKAMAVTFGLIAAVPVSASLACSLGSGSCDWGDFLDRFMGNSSGGDGAITPDEFSLAVNNYLGFCGGGDLIGTEREPKNSNDLAELAGAENSNEFFEAIMALHRGQFPSRDRGSLRYQEVLPASDTPITFKLLCEKKINLRLLINSYNEIVKLSLEIRDLDKEKTSDYLLKIHEISSEVAEYVEVININDANYEIINPFFNEKDLDDIDLIRRYFLYVYRIGAPERLSDLNNDEFTRERAELNNVLHLKSSSEISKSNDRKLVNLLYMMTDFHININRYVTVE